MPQKDIHWPDDKTPASRRYGDIYYSPEDGLAESRYVFLRGIDAPKIWQDKDRFTLLENGFGTGLNFIMTCQAWRATAQDHARLIYIATEKHPLASEDINRALSLWPELDGEKDVLLAVYGMRPAGFHRFTLFGGRITLLLLVGDSAATLPALEATVDAIYLDGFAPQSNEEMWTPQIFTACARLAAPHARLATFTAAGFVRRGLQAAGFDMQKAPGFATKRDCLRGQFSGQIPPDATPWFRRPDPLPRGQRIAIIGGGIAGLTTAHALQRRGYQVTIFEAEALPMNQASGNLAAILDPPVTLGENAEEQLYRTALFHALDFYRAQTPEAILTPALRKYPAGPDQAEKFINFRAQKSLPSGFVCAGPEDTLDFPHCISLAPPRVREILTAQLPPVIKCRITALRHDGQWQLQTEAEETTHSADAVIICSGPAAITYLQTDSLPLTPVRGQISLLNGTRLPAPPEETRCGAGYLIPPIELEGRPTLVSGATFQRDDCGTDVRPEDHLENLANAAALWPEAAPFLTLENIIGGRAALRAYSPDHLPLCGPVPNHEAYQVDYVALHHGARHKNFPPAPYHPQLYITAGLGARGFMTAPLIAELTAAQISGDALPLPRALVEALHPARFIVRRLRKAP